MKPMPQLFCDLFALTVPKDNKESYTWKEIVIGILIQTFLGFGISLMG